MGNHLLAHQSSLLLLTCTEVNVYLYLTWIILLCFQGIFSKSLIKKTYINDNIGGSPENTGKRKISHILETTPTHATHCSGEKWLCTTK